MTSRMFGSLLSIVGVGAMMGGDVGGTNGGREAVRWLVAVGSVTLTCRGLSTSIGTTGMIDL